MPLVSPEHSKVTAMPVSGGICTATTCCQEACRESEQACQGAARPAFEKVKITCAGCAAAAVMLLKLTWKDTCWLALLTAWPKEG